MLQCVFFIFDFMKSVFLSLYRVDIGFGNVDLASLLIGFVATSMIITVFWKGARG